MNPLIIGAFWGGLVGLLTNGVAFAADLGNLATLAGATSITQLAIVVMTIKYVAIFAMGGLITSSRIAHRSNRRRSPTCDVALAPSY